MPFSSPKTWFPATVHRIPASQGSYKAQLIYQHKTHPWSFVAQNCCFWVWKSIGWACAESGVSLISCWSAVAEADGGDRTSVASTWFVKKWPSRVAFQTRLTRTSRRASCHSPTLLWCLFYSLFLCCRQTDKEKEMEMERAFKGLVEGAYFTFTQYIPLHIPATYDLINQILH